MIKRLGSLLPKGLYLSLLRRLGSQAYIKKGHTPIQVFPVPNAYTTFKQTAPLS